jgi:hypothetical protein
MAVLKLAQFQFSLNKSEKSDLPLGQLAPVSPTCNAFNWTEDHEIAFTAVKAALTAPYPG